MITENLDRASDDKYGITAPDNNKVMVNGGTLSVNTNNLSMANSADLGVISIDNSTIILNDDAQITIKDSDKIRNDIDSLSYSLANILEQFNSLKEEILSQINE